MLSPPVWKILKVFGHLPRNLLEPHQPSAPEPLDLICFRPRNPPEPWLICTGALPNPPELHQLSAPEPSGTSSAICTRTSGPHLLSASEPSGTLADLHRSPPEPAGTSSAICTGTLWNLISHLDRNPPLHHLSAPEPSGTSSAICTGTLRNFISHLHRTLRNLLRNLVLQLHRIAPELFWAKDPIASFAVGEKSNPVHVSGTVFNDLARDAVKARVISLTSRVFLD